MSYQTKRAAIIGSPAYALAKHDLYEAGKVALTIGGAALIAGLVSYSGTLDMTTTQGIVSAAVVAVVLDFVRRFVSDTAVKP